jgi:hypothetical protein
MSRSGLMPTYQFLNSNTNEVEEYTMRISELDKFKEDNPHLERYFSAETLPSFGDSMRMSVPGYGQGVQAFEQGVIQRIKDTVPGNNLHKTHKTKAPKEW